MEFKNIDSLEILNLKDNPERFYGIAHLSLQRVANEIRGLFSNTQVLIGHYETLTVAQHHPRHEWSSNDVHLRDRYEREGWAGYRT